MRLEHAHIENFKLLEDIKLDFSTDPEKPLTVIRAENGSGKTSLLYALLWAFYGSAGLPAGVREVPSRTRAPAQREAHRHPGDGRVRSHRRDRRGEQVPARS